MKKKKLTMKKIIGYSAGEFIETYTNFSSFYLIMFLTTVAGVSAGTAGIIATAGSLIMVFAAPVSGRLCSKMGRKRHMMMLFIIPFCVCGFLVFSNFALNDSQKIVYYFVMHISVTICYAFISVPYTSLGASLTENYTERSTIRSMNTICRYVAVLIGGTVCFSLIGLLTERGISEEYSWQLVMIVVISPIMIMGVISVLQTTRGIEDNDACNLQRKEKKPSKLSISLIFEKNMLGIGLFILCYYIGNIVLGSGIIYIAKYCLGTSNAEASMFYTMTTIATIAFVPVVTFLATKVGKKRMLMISCTALLAICIFMLAKGFDSYMDLVLVAVFSAFTGSGAVTMGYAMVYDIVELEEFKTGRNVASELVGMYTTYQFVGAAIGQFTLGQILARGGFDGSVLVQTQHMKMTLQLLVMAVPLIITVVGVFCLFILYKITPANYEALLTALKLKRDGQPYHTYGFKELLK